MLAASSGSEETNQENRCQLKTIDVLPDDLLLVIFVFFLDADRDPSPLIHPIRAKKGIDAWQLLVHVCRRWRGVVFGSPRCLNLRLVCSNKKPARDTLDVWPSLPLLIWNTHPLAEGIDNIIPVLELRDHVCQIYLPIPPPQLEKVSAAMQKPFPELTGLSLGSHGEMATVLPDSFLGGSAPRLQHLKLNRVPFPGLMKLLLSATHLVSLYLKDIPHSGYISPEAMTTTLSTLTALENLWIIFASPQSRPDLEGRLPPPPTRSVLPALNWLRFEGVSEYLDDLVARIDAPRLDHVDISFFDQIVFDTPQFFQFVNRAPRLKAFKKARVDFKFDRASAEFFSISSQISRRVQLDVRTQTRHTELDWYPLSLEQVCTSCLPPLSTLEDLYFHDAHHSLLLQQSQDNAENTLWLELLHPFAAVKNLYLAREFVPRIARALQELVGDRTTEVLPALQNLYLEGLQPCGPVRDAIGQFVAARHATSHPISIYGWTSQSLTNY